MSNEPYAFNFDTAKDLVRLIKRTKNGEFAPEIDDTVPIDASHKFVWAYVPSNATGTYDTTIKAWKLNGSTKYFPINIGKDSNGYIQYGKMNEAGVINGGVDCTIWLPRMEGTQTAPSVGKGFYLGQIFGFDSSQQQVPMVLIPLPPAAGTGSGGSAVIDVVNSVTCTPTGIEVGFVTLSGADYDNAVIRNFLALSDVTPKTFLGNQGRVVRVNDSGTALEFGAVTIGTETTFISLTDTPEEYGDKNTYKSVTVSSNNKSVVFSDNDVVTDFSISGGGNPNSPSYTKITLVNDEDEPTSTKFYGCINNVKGWNFLNFTTLHDTPDNYINSAGKFLKINKDADGIEFTSNAFTSLTDCPQDYTGASLKFLRVNNLESKIEFVDSKFTTLQDVPDSYAGHGLEFVRVKQQEDGLEFYSLDLTQILADIDTLQEDIQTLSLTVDDHETRIVILETDVAVAKNDISNLQSTVSTNTSDILSIQGTIPIIQGDIVTLQSSLNSLESTVNSLDSTVSGHTTSISTLQTDLSNLNTTVGQLTTQVTTLESTVTSLESTVNSLDSTVSSHTSQISILESSVTTLQGQVSTLEGTVSTHTGQISTLESGLAAAESNITQIQSEISSIQTDLQTVTTGLTQAQSDISQLQSDVTQHGSDIADILSRLSTAESNIQSLQTDLATAQGDISTLQTSMANAELSITNLQSDLATAQNDITSNYSSLDARITALGG